MGRHSHFLFKIFAITSCCFLSIAHGQSLDCVDTDGDGWGWNGVESCFIERVVNTCVDPDGDGYGWNGVETCDPDSQSASGICIYPGGDSSQWGWNEIARESCPPVISGQCIDADGDGWGWNGLTSCPVPVCITAGGYVRDDLGICVGVPDEVILDDYSSDMSESVPINFYSGAVVEGKRILGCVRLIGQNIIFRNNYVKCYLSRDIAAETREVQPDDYRGPIYIDHTSDNVVVENNTIVCEKREEDIAPCDYGVLAENAVVRNNYIVGSVDGIDVRSNSEILFNVIENLSVTNEEWRNDYSHADGIQLSFPSSDITIEGNVIRGVSENESTDARNDALGGILLQGTSSSQSGPAIVVKNNYIAGYWPANRIRCFDGAACNIEGNTFDDHYPVAINIRGSEINSTIQCNVFSNGQFIESENIISGEADNSNCMLP